MRILKVLAPHRGWLALAGGLAVLMLVLALSPAIRSLSQRAESYIQPQSAPSVTLPPFDELYSPEAMEYFLAAAAFGEHGPDAAEPDLPRLGFIHKWNQDINICVEGANDVDRVVVFWVIVTVRPLIEPIEINQVDCAEEYNFRVVFTSVARFGDYISREFDTDGRFIHAGTVAGSIDERGLIYGAIALINTDIPTDFPIDLRQIVRTSATWEEISQGLGSIHDSYYDDQSLFYEGTNLVYKLSDIDEELIRILYDPRIKLGMRYCDVYQLLRSESSASFVASSAALGAGGPDRC